MSKYNELTKKLKEIFQIDRPELDFGIYRILNARADEINDYLDNKLKAKIQTALADAGNANKAELEQQLQAAIKAATDAGFEPEQSPKVQELKGQLEAAASGASEHENAVFSHLLTFFSRYYDNGDFISKRRYKGDTYAIPYAGEEVMLHWANKDQYYIKSGENFANYSFKLDDGRKVSFKLLAADTAKDNRKDNDADRRFVLIEPHTRTKLDEDGEEYEQAYQAVEVVKTTELVNGESVENEELVIHFEYKAMKKGTKQDALVQNAITTILADSEVQQHWIELTKRAPTEKNPNRTELERHLTTYTQRNTADYFIHKDLGGFLSNELDFYIKNEVMNLDNVQNAEVFSNIEKQLRMIQCLRSVSQEIITFLAQIENFQKKLWNKRKFVSSSEYLVTLDKVPEHLYSIICGNDKQWGQWKGLGLVNTKVENKLDWLEKHPGLSVDTSLFNEEFKADLLSSFDDLDQEMTGIMLNSDNYQALNAIKNKFKGKVSSVYIDPPYNTSASEILYKNSYKHSSWLSMMQDRLNVGKELMSDEATQCATIDDAEFNELNLLISEIFGQDNITGIVPIKINPSGRPTERGFALTHEYAIFSGRTEKASISKVPRSDEQLKRFKEKDNTGIFEYRNLRREGSNSDRVDGQRQFYPIFANLESGCVRVPNMEWIESDREWITHETPCDNEVVIYPVTDSGREKNWRWSEANVRADYSQFLARIPKGSDKPQVYYKYRPNLEGVTPLTFWSDSKFSATEHGTKVLKDLFGDTSFSYPKSIHAVEECLRVMGVHKSNGLVMDYFSGSGTTGHAVINMNRNMEMNNKFILVEQGAYFDTVTKPRIQKATYSNSWKNGKAETMDHVSQCIKVVKLEGYEDTLNNISLSKGNSDLFDFMSPELANDYLLKYMLGEESKSSLLNTDNFRKPFNYEMDIAADSAGATERKTIDLVETFNFLIGLHVKSIESNVERGYVRIEGTLPTGERTLILWRDCDKIGYEKLNEYANRFDLYAKEQTFDVIYINGDHNLPTAFTVDGEDGEVMRSLKLRQIEPEFLSLMFVEEA
ncbi:site-specific DNA-methyltransferase [Vibrio paracholerae]|uniref:site-specific DNA-methyltransferase n=1 Tax=Vibrio paracholerae TaxID=650003 RepID=UPI0020941AEA|nr:DNA methyltransferase [Vibrio paracholerae]MCO7067648.1 site-specific DNA-methyltransferase [Vibrio paracholerae]